MANPSLSVRKCRVILVIAPYYMCDVCGNVQKGRVYKTEDDYDNVPKDAILKPPSNQYMPIGWSYGRLQYPGPVGYTCWKCNGHETDPANE
jgi:hypothetical protein